MLRRLDDEKTQRAVAVEKHEQLFLFLEISWAALVKQRLPSKEYVVKRVLPVSGGLERVTFKTCEF